MSLPPQLECVGSFRSRTTIENSPRVTDAAIPETCQKPAPGSTLESNQNHDRPLTSDADQQLQEELAPDYTIDLSDAAASRENIEVTLLQTLIAMFRKREHRLLYGEVQDETAETAKLTAVTMETILQLISVRIASHVQTQGKLLPRQTINTLLTPTEFLKVLKREKSTLLGTAQRLRENVAYMTGQMDQLCAENKQVWGHNSELKNKLKALEMENIELRRSIEAPKSELYDSTKTQHPEVLSIDHGHGGKRNRDVSGSDLQAHVREKSPAEKRSKFE